MGYGGEIAADIIGDDLQKPRQRIARRGDDERPRATDEEHDGETELRQRRCSRVFVGDRRFLHNDKTQNDTTNDGNHRALL